ncbi:MAG: peptide-binding protein [Pseudomonadales bacterium]
MGNRFGLKDILLYLILGGILVSIWLAMVQMDRQWLLIRQTQGQLEEQTRDLADIRRQLQRGLVVADGAGASAAASQWGGFARALQAEQMPDYATGDWYVDYFPDDLQKLTPVLSSDAYATVVQQQVLDTLITRDPETLEWLPLVAQSWEILDGGLTVRFKLRRGVTFSDGEPLTAADVAFTFRFVMDERVAGPRWRAYLSRIKSVEADGDEVVFRYEEPYFGSFELAGTLPILAEHFYGPFLESDEAAEQFNRSTGLLLGSGPYKLTDPRGWAPGQGIELVRNERYWGPVRPAFDRIIYKIIQNDAALLTEFKNGDIDFYRARPLDYRNLTADPSVTERAQSYEYYDARGGYIYIAWNEQLDGKPTRFADRRVREALTYLSDRQRMCDEIMLGYARPANGPFNPMGRQINAELPTRPFDLDRARALLKEAGFEDRDGDGVIEDADGVPFRFTFTYPSGSDDYKRVVLLLKDLYVQAGIILDPEPTDWPLVLKALDDKTFDAISLGWTSSFEIDLYQYFHSSQMEPGGDNFISYSNPELDRLIEQARATMDEETRLALWHRAHEILWHDQPYTFLFWRSRLDFIDRRIANVQRVRAGLNWPGLWRMPGEWYVPKDRQKYDR